MKVVSYPTVTEFWHVAGTLFMADPVRNTVAVTVAGRLLRGGRFGDVAPIFLTVHNTSDSDGDLVGAAFCTPPFPISVSGLPVRAMTAVADHLVAIGARPSGASGIRPEVEAFTAAWAERTGATQTGQIDQRLYELADLDPPTGVPGAASVATDADLDLLTDWRIEFAREAHGQRPDSPVREDVEHQVRDALDAGGQLLWRVDGRPVSFAMANRPQSGMSRIGPVYTPAEHRGHGYGSAVTAAAGQWALDLGAEHVILFTDLANPVSNSIYQRIGFTPIADALEVSFA
jgi:GNAT superfamily N-acetyltransferase